MSLASAVYMCQVTDCGKKIVSARALGGHMNLQHVENKRLGIVCAIDDCGYQRRVLHFSG